jgi:hypothetical protein
MTHKGMSKKNKTFEHTIKTMDKFDDLIMNKIFVLGLFLNRALHCNQMIIHT